MIESKATESETLLEAAADEAVAHWETRGTGFGRRVARGVRRAGRGGKIVEL